MAQRKKTGGAPGMQDKASTRKASTRKASTRKASTRKASTRKASTAAVEENKRGAYFPIVGIGASAGGLEAIEQFFKNMPASEGIAFVVVSHLDPSHASMMTSLIQRFTKMTVVEVTDGLPVEPDHVYVIPPNRNISVYNKTLYLSMPVEYRGPRTPIDYFFRSLAVDQGDRSICIVLSGAGSDGTLGLRAINGVGGMSMVQDPNSAKYRGMPESAIDTGLPDYILPPEKMPKDLVAYASRFHMRVRGKIAAVPEKVTGDLQRIFMLLRGKTGHDFSMYKKNTILRRIEKRMSVHQFGDMATYVKYLREHPDELETLFKEFLIGVTNFFREADAFEVLRKKVLPKLLAGKPDYYEFRAWVPGCSTGEEAYSIAMVLHECLEEMKKNMRVQVFGTDIDADAINKARFGRYPGNIALDVSPERLKSFFMKEGSDFRIKREIREEITFAIQNLIKDPPFTKLDMISCRNLLIYIEPELQKKLINLFHYSLKPGGILFLGPSETIGGFTDLFSTVEKKWMIYRSKESKTAIGALPIYGIGDRLYADKQAEMKTAAVNVANLAQKALLANFAPPSVIVNSKGEIIYIHGQTGKYLEPSPGQPTMNVFDMARKGLRAELRTAVQTAVGKKREVKFGDLKVQTNGGIQRIDLIVRPIHESEEGAQLYLVVFHDAAAPPKKEPEEKPIDRRAASSKELNALQEELKYTQENLQATIEELEASNEELKSTNEELQATNEELQSTNEELESSKEELQSVNEELVTVNTELQDKLELLSRTESDMKNLLDNVSVGVIFLDKELKIVRYTSEIGSVMNLLPSDVGRPIANLVTNLEGIDLAESAATAFASLQFSAKEVASRDGKRYIMRTMPYRTVENVIDGVVITFTDVTDVRKQEADFRKQIGAAGEALKYMEAIVETLREPFLILDDKLNVVSANAAFHEFFGMPAETIKNRNLFEIGDGDWSAPDLKKGLSSILKGEGAIRDFEAEVRIGGGGIKKMLVNAKRVQHEGVMQPFVLMAMQEAR